MVCSGRSPEDRLNVSGSKSKVFPPHCNDSRTLVDDVLRPLVLGPYQAPRRTISGASRCWIGWSFFEAQFFEGLQLCTSNYAWRVGPRTYISPTKGFVAFMLPFMLSQEERLQMTAPCRDTPSPLLSNATCKLNVVGQW